MSDDEEETRGATGSAVIPPFEACFQDGATLRAVFEGLSPLADNTIRLFFGPKGLEIAELVCSEEVFIYAFLDAKYASVYDLKGNKELVITVKTFILSKVLAACTRDTPVRFFCGPNASPNRMGVELLVSDSRDIAYEIPAIVTPAQKRHIAPFAQIDYAVAFNSAKLVNILKELASFAGDFSSFPFVNIGADANQITFQIGPDGCDGIVSQVRITLRTNDVSDESIVAGASEGARRKKRARAASAHEEEGPPLPACREQPGAVQRFYRLVYLQEICKLLKIDNGMVLMYVDRALPLVFELKLTCMGVMKITVLYHQREDDPLGGNATIAVPDEEV